MKDFAGVNVENQRGIYTVTLSLTPTGNFSGVVSASTAQGTFTFENIRVLSANSFVLTASSSGVTSASTAQFTVVSYLHTITMSSNVTSVSAGFPFSITTVLKGEDNNAFLGTCILALSEASSSIVGTLSSSITTGTGTFNVYIATSGSKTITASCPAVSPSPAVSQDFIMTILSLKLVIASISPTVIFT